MQLFQNHRLSVSYTPNLLKTAMDRLHNWLNAQFKAFPFSGFDNSFGADFWIYAVHHRQVDIIDFLSKVGGLESTDVRMTIAELKNLVTPSVELCWSLIPFLNLHSRDGYKVPILPRKYSMTMRRRTRCTIFHFQRLLRNPK